MTDDLKLCTKKDDRTFIQGLNRSETLSMYSLNLVDEEMGRRELALCALLYFTLVSTYCTYITCGTHSLFISCSIILDLNPLKFMHDGMMNPISNKELLACF